MIEVVKYELDVPKELKEVVDLLDAVLAKVLAKESLASYTELFDELVKAGEGIGAVGDEAKSQYRDEAAGYLVHKLLGRLMPVKEAPPAPPE